MVLLFVQKGLASLPAEVEPKYAEALLAYHRGQHSLALNLVRQALYYYPEEVQLHELSAMTLKEMGREEEAAKVYEYLIRKSRHERHPMEQRAPYHYELGLIHYRKKQYKAAEQRFDDALASNFNAPAILYFLGMIDFEKQSWEQARNYFTEVTQMSVDSLKPAAYLHLGKIAAKTNDTRGMIKNLFLARSEATKRLNQRARLGGGQQLSNSVVAAINQALGPYDRSSFFGSTRLISGYDSNVLLTSEETSTPSAGASGRGSFLSILQAGVGFATTPLGEYQLITNYQFTGNYYSNGLSRTRQILSNKLEVYVTRFPLDSLNCGIRFQGVGAFRLEDDASGTDRKYRFDTFQGQAGPYIRYLADSDTTLGFDYFFQKQRYELDYQNASSFNRTGSTHGARLFAKRDRGGGKWNPGAFLNLNIRDSIGTEVRSKGVGLSANNTYYLTDKTVLTFGLNFGLTFYTERTSGFRGDKNVSVSTSATHQLRDDLVILGDLAYIKNYSSVKDPYQYNRFRLSAGLNYVF